MAGKKPFKFELWMLGAAIIPFGIGIAIWSYSLRDSVELGGECSDREQCKRPATQCMKLGEKLDFKQVCTDQCSGKCPAGLECVGLDVRFGGAFTGVNVPNASYCFRPELAKKLKAAR